MWVGVMLGILFHFFKAMIGYCCGETVLDRATRLPLRYPQYLRGENRVTPLVTVRSNRSCYWLFGIVTSSRYHSYTMLSAIRRSATTRSLVSRVSFFSTDDTFSQRSRSAENKYALEEEWRAIEKLRAKLAEQHSKHHPAGEPAEFQHFESLDDDERSSYAQTLEKNLKVLETVTPFEWEGKDKLRAKKAEFELERKMTANKKVQEIENLKSLLGKDVDPSKLEELLKWKHS